MVTAAPTNIVTKSTSVIVVSLRLNNASAAKHAHESEPATTATRSSQ